MTAKNEQGFSSIRSVPMKVLLFGELPVFGERIIAISHFQRTRELLPISVHFVFDVCSRMISDSLIGGRQLTRSSPGC